jgi:ATP-binding cassette subfamily F protein uup
LSDSALYRRDPDGFLKLSSRLSAAQTELAAAEERWLELEMRREGLGR